MNDLFSVKDKVVVITGSTGVLGSCIARYLAKEGATVVILGRRTAEGDEIVSSITAEGGEAMFLTSDVMDTAVVQANCDAVMAKRLSSTST